MDLSVIVCDDSRFARSQLIKSLPNQLKVNLKEASDGLEALELIRNGFGDLMFLDLNMPNVDGYQVLETIKKESLDILVIVITGDIQQSAQSRILSLGALAFIKKPLDIAELEKVLVKFGLADEMIDIDSNKEEKNVANIPSNISYQEKLQEVINVAMGQAAKTLADLMNLFINLPVPKVSMKTGQNIYDELSAKLQDQGNIIISTGFSGSEINGEVLIYFSNEDIDNLIHLLVDEDDMTSSRKGTIIELSNLIISTFLTGVSEQLGSQFSKTHPSIVKINDKIQLLSPELIQKQILNVKLTYAIPDHNIKCDLMVLFSENSMNSLQKRLSFI